MIKQADPQDAILRAGFGKVDITPRVGVQLWGYGPFLNRQARAIRERLYARAFAASDGDNTIVLLSCDLGALPGRLTKLVRQIVKEEAGLQPDQICVHCIHTHSGPNGGSAIGWGDADPPYLEILPHKLARACVEAVGSLQPASLSHIVVPCEGIGYDREEDVRPSLSEALSEGWRPHKPEGTDTQAHVLRVDAGGRMLGFLSYFSCHPVVGSAESTFIHSDFVGLATNWLERQHSGSVGLFLQGCHGNINTCVVHHGEQESLLALDVIAARYARQIAPGIRDAQLISATPVRALRRSCELMHAVLPEAKVRRLLAEQMVVLHSSDASDAGKEERMAMVYAIALRKELDRIASGEPYEEAVDLQAFRLGELVIVGAPFELYNRYRRRVQDRFDQPVLVLSLCNDALGYAPEKESFVKEDNYAAKIAPYIMGCRPFTADIEDDLVRAMIALIQEISTEEPL